MDLDEKVEEIARRIGLYDLSRSMDESARRLEAMIQEHSHPPDDGWSAYTRKRRGEVNTHQVPTKMHASPDTSLPSWKPPKPTPPPQEQSQPTHPPPKSSPLFPNPSPIPNSNHSQTIPPLMSIRFTPIPYAT